MLNERVESPWSQPNDVVVPFMACGDLSGYDADQSYDLPTYDDEVVDESGGGGGGWGGGGGYKPLEPVQPPIAPPYKTAIAKERERVEQRTK